MNLIKENIQSNIEEIKKDIKEHSIYPEKVKFIAVTKYGGLEVNQVLLDLGMNIFGENKAQLIKEKYDHFIEKDINNIEWHFIGNLQKNKVKYIADYVKLIHSVNKLSLAKEIDKRAKQNNRVIDVLLEINIAGEETKEGYDYQDLVKDIPELKKLENINIIGLMTMAPFVDDEPLVRGVFKKLREIKDDLNEKYFNGTLTELSMGMTNDYKIALEEGATIIRIGRKIYN
ncbi:Pyridoxal phosphate homeostasis protein [Fusobacterium sp. DD29]|uniref:YggS family pyridoxal phosphate-dependent enzyme n=1 Tax=unclassified Fusobacterium TaxID=2648384 RepID=UPI001B8B4CED|nr:MULTISPECIES: YggS family pyridoxal phosphate-dependent enzyme [unclassified Fusobacterium]MBR8701864.1 Pyridoxal phosphate homeostasis protein [Fusobacterium sp. DD45]MBR8711654.1 Pyridoxal phosphate homeostasis protein [Fusobacterium sp. DD28]MBR8749211.1 Pyridoxal phosphate homeostasis protein [Fusobacterium sp. DD29]MBR8752203.1 Pyridoxal phosphate homeostasis protein [Fusobacterium sp. DD26]MBR8761451.1 Pyridoxal phosphate homeostasis protein [Fusobacterium sp. DD25]